MLTYLSATFPNLYAIVEQTGYLASLSFAYDAFKGKCIKTGFKKILLLLMWYDQVYPYDVGKIHHRGDKNVLKIL